MALTFKGRVVRDPDAQLNFEQLTNTISTLTAADTAEAAARAAADTALDGRLVTVEAKVSALTKIVFGVISTVNPSSTFTVTHGLGGTPTAVVVSSFTSSTVLAGYVTARTSTTFTVMNPDSAVGVSMFWIACR